MRRLVILGAVLAAGAARADCDLTSADCTTKPEVAGAASGNAPSLAAAYVPISPGRTVRDCSVSSYVPQPPGAARSPLDPPAAIVLTPLANADLDKGRVLEGLDYRIEIRIVHSEPALAAYLSNHGTKPRAVALYCRYAPSN